MRPAELVNERPARVTSKPLTGRPHLAHLDGARAVAALYVAFYHASLQVNLGRDASRLTLLTAKLLDHGHFAVVVFIVLSGFCLTLPTLPRNATLSEGSRSFFLRRTVRILPPYYLAMGLSLLLIATLIGARTGDQWDQSIPVTRFDIITHLLLIQDVFVSTDPKINHVFWSISVEWRIYFLFPMLLWSWRRFGPFASTFASVAVSLLCYATLVHTPLNVEGMSLHFVGLFVIGMLAAQIAYGDGPRDARWRAAPWLPVAALSACLGLVFRVVFRGSWLSAPTQDLAIGAAAAGLLVLMARERSRLRELMALRPLAWVGSISYSLYLIHAPLLQVLTEYVVQPLKLGSNAEYWVTLALCPLLVAPSYLFFLACERPFTRLQHRLVRRARP